MWSTSYHVGDDQPLHLICPSTWRPVPDTQEMQTALLVLAAITAIGWGIFVLDIAVGQRYIRFLERVPVPTEEVRREFEAGDTAEDICVRTINALRDVGANKIYLSNLGFKGVDRAYGRIMDALEA